MPVPTSPTTREAVASDSCDGLMSRYPDTEAKNLAFEVFQALDRLDPADIGAVYVGPFAPDLGPDRYLETLQ